MNSSYNSFDENEGLLFHGITGKYIFPTKASICLYTFRLYQLDSLPGSLMSHGVYQY